MQSSNHCIQCTLFRGPTHADEQALKTLSTLLGNAPFVAHDIDAIPFTSSDDDTDVIYTCFTSLQDGVTIASSLTPAYASASDLNRALHQDSTA